jgi:adenine-specific DNA-methyltransferase
MAKNLIDELKSLLQKDERLASGGELLKNKIIELAIALDKDLLELLLSHSKIKKTFFTQVGKTTIFDKDKFIKFISNKQFLPDSYTAFKNKIGLIENDKYISEKKEVVLSWPYKDCVLEGGQTKEEAKREEIFWNQTLAPDEISRLLEPKVFTNAKRIDKNGKHEFDKFKTDKKGNIKDNLIIKGNNLLALHSLKERFAGKVKLIYIDPPYNTGNDSFGYNDRFNHSSWLTFMKNRLEVAKELLAKDGSIYIQLDYNEVHYFKVLMDEVFGGENFQREIIWYLSGAAGYKSLVNNYVRAHDTLLYYSKSGEVFFNKEYLPYGDEQLSRFSKIDKQGKKYKTITKERRLYLDEAKGIPITDVWTDIASFQTIVNSPEITGFHTQKPEPLLRRIIQASSSEGDVVLDFFAGSGTTGAVAQKMNRQSVMIEQIPRQMDILRKRVAKAIRGDQSGISEDVGWRGGGDYVYLELAQWNEAFVEQIKKAKTGKELEKIWKILKEKAHLSYKVDIATFDNSVKEFSSLSLANQKRFLFETLDQNHLYINYSEINDGGYGIDKENKKINKEFYGRK